MTESLSTLLEQRDKHWPSVAHYGELLGWATGTLHISTEEARVNYGLLSYAEWAELMLLRPRTMKVERTTFKADGIDEPCILVSDEKGYAQVRISKCYHYVGPDGLYVREILGGEFNSEEEQMGDFDGLTDEDAIQIAKEFSAYL